MAIRTGASKIRTGTPKIAQRQPPQIISHRDRREAPQKEIAFIAETKKLEEARAGTRRDRRHREEEPRTITELIQELKDSDLEAAEAGYALSKLIKTDIELKPTLKAWCDIQITQYQKVMDEAKARYKEELQELKDKYPDDPIKYTNARLKLMAKVYPKWSRTAQQAKEKFEDRQDTLAKAITAAKQAGIKDMSYDELYVMATTTKASAKKQAAEKGLTKQQLANIRGVELRELYEPKEIAGTRIVLTGNDIPRELRMASAEERQNWGITKVDGEWQQEVIITATGQYVPANLYDALSAEQRQGVISSLTGTIRTIFGGGVGAIVVPEAVTEPVRFIRATDEERREAGEAKAEAEARGWWCYATIQTFKVTLTNGSVILVEALDSPKRSGVASAREKAEAGGHKVAWVTKKMQGETVEPQLEETGSSKVALKGGSNITVTASTTPDGEPTWTVAELEPYKDKDGNYDLIRIIEETPISQEAMKWLFGKDTLDWAKDVQQTKDVLDKLKKYKDEDGYSLTQALADGAITRAEAEIVFDKEAVNKAMGNASLVKAASSGELTGGIRTVSGQHTATAAEVEAAKSERFTPKEIGLLAAEILVPFVYVVRHWDELSVAERALWIAADIALFIAPMAAASVRGARGALAVGRTARATGAAKGVGRELVLMVKGPLTSVMHPVATTKQALADIRSLVTNIAHPKKIPEAVLTTTEGTLRLKVTGATNADEFMVARDKLISLAARGERPFVELKDKSGKVIATLEITTAPLMREVKGGVVHTTPWGAQFGDVLTVNPRPGMPVREQGLFVSHEPLPRFATQSAFNLPVEVRPAGTSNQIITTRFGGGQVANIHLQAGLSQDIMETLAKSKLIEIPGQQIQPLSGGQLKKLINTLRNSGNTKAADAFQQTVDAYKPVFRIISPDKADELIKSEKIYRGGAEIEAKFPVGTKIEPPKQVLFTHIGPEATRVELWLDKPLSAKQIARLKAEGLAEVFRQPFRAPLKIEPVKGAGLSKQQVNQLADIIKASGDTKLAQSLERAYQLARSRQQLTRVLTSAGLLQAGRIPSREATPARARAESAEAVKPVERAARAERDEEIEYLRLRDETERAQRTGRVERTARAERTSRVERGERTRRSERTERTGRTERPVRTTRTRRPERPVRPVRPERPIRLERPTKTTKTTTEGISTKLGFKGLPRQADSLISWRQGMYYITIVEPYRTTGQKPDVIYSRHRPPWGKVLKGKHSPQRTLRSIGKVPNSIMLPMGATTARVKHGKLLRFSPK